MPFRDGVLEQIQGGAQGRPQSSACGNFIGQSKQFFSVMKSISKVAVHNCPVIISGPTGTGKDMVAREIHRQSQRSRNVFIPVNCGVLTGPLFESEMFGHAKGAFTGAFDSTLGFFRAAHKGTIFLDEIGELTLDFQVKLLRILQEGVVTPVGSTQSYPVDVRVICATNRDLEQMVKDGSFRADLYFRINVVEIKVPALKERKEDIGILANYFLERYADFYMEPAKSLSAETVKALHKYDWPGNVRELANIIERAYIMSESDVITTESLPDRILRNEGFESQQDEFFSLETVKKRHVVRALEMSKGQKMAAAKLLKINPRTLSGLMEKYDLQPLWK